MRSRRSAALRPPTPRPGEALTQPHQHEEHGGGDADGGGGGQDSVARAAGLDAVPAHGMLSMAYLARLLTDGWLLDELASFEVRFTALTPVGSAPTFIAAAHPGDDDRAVVDLEGRLEDGTVTVRGRAVLRRR